MKQINRILALLLALALMGALAACGDSAPAAEDPNLGLYRLTIFTDMSVEEYAQLMEMGLEEAKDSMTVELKSGGKCVVSIDGDASELKWSLSGDKLTITDGGDNIPGTLADGVMVLDFEGDSITLAKDSVAQSGSSGSGGGIKNIGDAAPTPEPTPEPWGDEYSAGGITVTFPYEWAANDQNWSGPWAAIRENGEQLGGLYLQSSTPADPAVAAGYLGDTFTRTYGGREFVCAFRGSLLDTDDPSYSLDLYSSFSDERCLDVRLSLGKASQEELLAFADREIFDKVLSSIQVNPADFVDPNKGVDPAGFECNNSGELTAYTGSETEIVIPASIQGRTVIAIGNSCFKDNTDLASVTLPDTLQWIDHYAFQGCTSLETVEFQEGLSYIGAHAFAQCESLTNVELPATVTELDVSAFEEAGSGGTFKAPGAVSYGRYALAASGFDEIYVGDGSDLSEDAVFSGCLADTIELGAIQGAIGRNCFNSTEYLIAIEIPEGVTSLGEGCFLGSGVLAVDLPESLEEIGRSCFSFTDLEYLVIPAGVKRIGEDGVAVYVVMLMGNELELDEDAISCQDLLLPFVYSGDDVHFNIDPDHCFVWHQIQIAMDATPDESAAFDEFLISQGQEDISWFGMAPGLLYYDNWVYDTEKWTALRYYGSGGRECVPLAVPYEEDGYSGVTVCEIIADGCYADSDITGLAFHSSVWAIGSRILEGCDQLEELYFTAQLLYSYGEDFAADAFAGIPDGVTVYLPASLSEEEIAVCVENLQDMGLPDTAVFDFFDLR